MNKKEPDLIIERQIGQHASEGIEFYIDYECLEIKAWNSDSDSMTIILDPEEINQLGAILKRIK